MFTAQSCASYRLSDSQKHVRDFQNPQWTSHFSPFPFKVFCQLAKICLLRFLLLPQAVAMLNNCRWLFLTNAFTEEAVHKRRLWGQVNTSLVSVYVSWEMSDESVMIIIWEWCFWRAPTHFQWLPFQWILGCCLSLWWQALGFQHYSGAEDGGWMKPVKMPQSLLFLPIFSWFSWISAP